MYAHGCVFQYFFKQYLSVMSWFGLVFGKNKSELIKNNWFSLILIIFIHQIQTKLNQWKIGWYFENLFKKYKINHLLFKHNRLFIQLK